MARMVWCLALLRHAWAHALQCEEVTSITWAQVLVGLIMILLGIGIIYIFGYIFNHALLWAFQMETTQALEEFLHQQPRRELLLKILQVVVLTGGIAASISMAVLALSFAPITEGLSTLQGQIVLPKHPMECTFRAIIPASLPSLMHLLRCPEWYDVMSLTQVFIGAFVFFLGALAAFFLLVCLLALLGVHRLTETELKQWFKRWAPLSLLVFLGGAVASLVGAVMASGYLTDRLPASLDVHVFWPKDPRSCSLRMTDAPPLFPVHAGQSLSKSELDERQEYFVSLLLWVTMTALLTGQMLTCLGRTWRRPSEYAALLNSERISISPVEHLCMHLLCAGIVTWFVGSDRLSIQKGICWEAYVMWVFVMVCSSILQATYFVLVLPLESKVPNFGMPVIESTLPVLGEPLDTFKDWIFLGLATSTNDWLGYVFASFGALILLLSNLYLRRHHHEDLARAFLPVRSVCLPGEARGIFVKQTTPAKLAIALTEDFPQALLQSAFVAFFGGSATQYAFIGLSLTKIIMCVTLRAVILRREDKHGEAWASSIQYYKFKIDIFSCTFGRKHRWVLKAQTDLAENWQNLGRHAEALELRQAVLEVRREVLGPRDHATLTAEYKVGWSLARLRRGEEALQLFTENLEACQEAFGARDPNTLRAQAGMALALEVLGRPLEAAELKQEVLQVRREDLGARHPETLIAQHNFARSLRAAGRLQEALEQFEEVLQLSREVLGPKDPETLKCQAGVAQTLRKLGRHSEALQAFEELYLLHLEVLGPQHPHTLETLRDGEHLLREVEASNP